LAQDDLSEAQIFVEGHEVHRIFLLCCR
jgi:hypothetical protein